MTHLWNWNNKHLCCNVWNLVMNSSKLCDYFITFFLWAKSWFVSNPHFWPHQKHYARNCIFCYCVWGLLHPFKMGYVKLLSSFLMCINIASIIGPNVNSYQLIFPSKINFFNLIEFSMTKITQNSISLAPLV